MGKKQIISEKAPHPGVILKDVLSAHDLSQKDLAVAIGKTNAVISEILSGKRDINVEIALLLETTFEIPKAKEWMQYQSLYDIERLQETEKVKEQQKVIADWKALSQFVKLATIKKRLQWTSNMGDNLKKIYQLYQTDSIENLKQKISSTLSAACFRKSGGLQVDLENLRTWILLVRLASQDQTMSEKFSQNRVPALIKDLHRVFLYNEDTINNLGITLKNYGIKLVVEKKLEKVPVDGYSFWDGENPTIAITGRHSKLDKLAFTIFHELGHIVKHISASTDEDFLDLELNANAGSELDREKEANEYASFAIWNGVNYKSIFSSIPIPHNASRTLRFLSDKYMISLSIIVGQYQHFLVERTKSPAYYSVCTKLIENVKGLK